jgi:multidrug efflux pump subunit AcrB
LFRVEDEVTTFFEAKVSSLSNIAYLESFVSTGKAATVLSSRVEVEAPSG